MIVAIGTTFHQKIWPTNPVCAKMIGFVLALTATQTPSTEVPEIEKEVGENRIPPTYSLTGEPNFIIFGWNTYQMNRLRGPEAIFKFPS